LNNALFNKIDSGAAKVALQLPCKAGIDKVLPCGDKLLIVEKFVEKTLGDANRGEVVHLNPRINVVCAQFVQILQFQTPLNGEKPFKNCGGIVGIRQSELINVVHLNPLLERYATVHITQPPIKAAEWIHNQFLNCWRTHSLLSGFARAGYSGSQCHPQTRPYRGPFTTPANCKQQSHGAILRVMTWAEVRQRLD
jgi:hypothetical protein